jgi:outer membrane PBP1 activator LpoA protein
MWPTQYQGFQMKNKNILSRLLAISVLMWVTACSGPATKPMGTQIDATISAAEKLQNIRYLILAHDINSAQAILDTLDFSMLPEAEKPQHLFINIKLSVLDQDIQKAQQLLNGPDHALLDYLGDKEQIELSLLRSDIYEFNHQYLASARERIFLAPMLKDETYELNHQHIWHNLLQIPEDELQQLNIDIKFPYDLQGWISLATISKQHQFEIDQQLTLIDQWIKEHPIHPAAKSLPGSLQMLPELINNRPEKIALLLPVTGRLGITGQAIKDGFMAAYYQNLQKHQKVPEIVIVDTAEGDITQHYQKALDQGAQLVVGPLRKSNLEKLNSLPHLSVPILGLNYINNELVSAEKLYQFGLSPEDEVRQIAQQAWRDGHKKVAVLALKGAWGERAYKAFEEMWLSLGGKIAEVQYYERNKDYNKPIKKLLNIDDSQVRAKRLRWVLAEKIEFTSRRRQDVDWIFLLAFPKEGRQIKPALSFHFASDLPVYASSHIYNGETSYTYNRDLNGVNFLDIPWILHNDPIKASLKKHYSKRLNSQNRLFALGVDAFQLHLRLQVLEALDYSRYYGKTGTLALDNDRRVLRKLTWAKFKRGNVRLSENKY